MQQKVDKTYMLIVTNLPKPWKYYATSGCDFLDINNVYVGTLFEKQIYLLHTTMWYTELFWECSRQLDKILISNFYDTKPNDRISSKY